MIRLLRLQLICVLSFRHYLLGQAQANSTTHQADPQHQIFYWTEFSLDPVQDVTHSFGGIARMHPEAWNVCYRVILELLDLLTPLSYARDEHSEATYGHTDTTHDTHISYGKLKVVG